MNNNKKNRLQETLGSGTDGWRSACPQPFFPGPHLGVLQLDRTTDSLSPKGGQPLGHFPYGPFLLSLVPQGPQAAFVLCWPLLQPSNHLSFVPCPPSH
jgi:hypothetical protein